MHAVTRNYSSQSPWSLPLAGQSYFSFHNTGWVVPVHSKNAQSKFSGACTCILQLRNTVDLMDSEFCQAKVTFLGYVVG